MTFFREGWAIRQWDPGLCWGEGTGTRVHKHLVVFHGHRTHKRSAACPDLPSLTIPTARHF